MGVEIVKKYLQNLKKPENSSKYFKPLYFRNYPEKRNDICDHNYSKRKGRKSRKIKL